MLTRRQVLLAMAVSGMTTTAVAAPVLGMSGAGAGGVDVAVTELDLAFTESAADAAGSGVDPGAAHGPAAGARVWLSPVVQDVSCALVGLTWDLGHVGDEADRRALAAAAFTASVRARSGGVWSSWRAAHRHGEAATQSAGARDGTEAVWVGDCDAVQVRIDAGPGVALPRAVRAVLVDPGSRHEDLRPGTRSGVWAQARAHIAGPVILRRGDWAADESLRRARSRYTEDIKVAFVHHSAETNTYAPGDVPRIMRGIYAFHVRGRGWSDVGYNFMVDKFGRIWEGRAGGISRPVVGAHTGGFNQRSFGIGALGDFDSAIPTREMIAAIAKVIAWKFAMYGGTAPLDPLDRTDLIADGTGLSGHPAGRLVGFARVSGHRDAGAPSCPGRHLYARLPQIRNLAQATLAGGAAR